MRGSIAVGAFLLVGILFSLGVVGSVRAETLDAQGLKRLLIGAGALSGNDEILDALQVLAKEGFFEDHAYPALQPFLAGAGGGLIGKDQAIQIALAQFAGKGTASVTDYQLFDGRHYVFVFVEAPDNGPMTGPSHTYRVVLEGDGTVVKVEIPRRAGRR